LVIALWDVVCFAALGRLKVKGWPPQKIVEALLSFLQRLFGDYFLRKLGARMESRESIEAHSLFPSSS
jgi:hypothetical protein